MGRVTGFCWSHSVVPGQRQREGHTGQVTSSYRHIDKHTGLVSTLTLVSSFSVTTFFPNWHSYESHTTTCDWNLPTPPHMQMPHISV